MRQILNSRYVTKGEQNTIEYNYLEDIIKITVRTFDWVTKNYTFH